MANLVPLNTFKSNTATVTTSDLIAYQAPTGVTTVVLLAQFSNIGTGTGNVSANIYRSGANTQIIKNFAVPEGDAASVLTGRLILEEGNRLYVRADENNKFKFVFSFLETANA
jgi:hypothetical protein